jgi:hypothetical protein
MSHSVAKFARSVSLKVRSSGSFVVTSAVLKTSPLYPSVFSILRVMPPSLPGDTTLSDRNPRTTLSTSGVVCVSSVQHLQYVGNFTLEKRHSCEIFRKALFGAGVAKSHLESSLPMPNDLQEDILFECRTFSPAISFWRKIPICDRSQGLGTVAAGSI